MFEDYKNALLDFYHLKKDNHRLSVNLDDPGREKIRKECVEVFIRKNALKDQDLIRSVFDPTNQSTDLVRNIERFNLDKFRSLVSFLVEGTGIRDEKLVKLLAWLIDFPSYNEWRTLSDEERKSINEEVIKYSQEENTQEEEPIIDTRDDEVTGALRQTSEPPTSITEGKITDGNKIDPDIKIPEPDGPKDPISIPLIQPRYIVMGCMILFLISGGSFYYWEKTQSAIQMPKKDEKCMYWNGDYFVPVKCEAQGISAPIIPLNLQTLMQQRKISLPDTLSNYSLRKVWYSSIGGNHEFFAYSGMHPVDTVKRLRPMTSYIHTKYTSYPRYLLNRLTWSICIIVFITIFGFILSRFKRKVNAIDSSPLIQ